MQLDERTARELLNLLTKGDEVIPDAMVSMSYLTLKKEMAEGRVTEEGFTKEFKEAFDLLVNHLRSNKIPFYRGIAIIDTMLAVSCEEAAKQAGELYKATKHSVGSTTEVN